MEQTTFYNHTAAYCLFPRLSFAERPSPMPAPNLNRFNEIKKERALGDRWTWVLPFPDAQEVVERAFPNSPSNESAVSGDTNVQRMDPTYPLPMNMNTFSIIWHSIDDTYDTAVPTWRLRASLRHGLCSWSDLSLASVFKAKDDRFEKWIVTSPFVFQKLRSIHARSKWNTLQHREIWNSVEWKEGFARWCQTSLVTCTCPRKSNLSFSNARSRSHEKSTVSHALMHNIRSRRQAS